jgi:hypothetical protein
MRSPCRSLTVLALSASTGCFSYRPLQPPAPELKRGAELRAELRAPERVRLTDITIENVALVQGEFVQWEPDSLMLSVLWLRAGTGTEHRANGETIVVPLAHVGRLQRKTVSLPRTAGLVGVALLGGTLFYAGMSSGASGNPGGQGPIPTR